MMLAFKSFKKASTGLFGLCDVIAVLAKRLCTGFIDPLTSEPTLANRFIPLDKGNGEVQPIGVGEVIRRIIRKCKTKVTKQDIVGACGSLQVCSMKWDLAYDIARMLKSAGYSLNREKICCKGSIP